MLKWREADQEDIHKFNETEEKMAGAEESFAV